MIGRIFAGVGLALAIFEVVLRHFYFVPWRIDPEFGCIVAPGAQAVYRREGNGTSHWTEHGVRRTAPLEPGRRPILAMGDSFTEAYMLDDDQVFTAKAEALLEQDGSGIPILNLGKSGQSTADYVHDADRNLRVFEPRWVVVQIREDDLEEDAWDPYGPHFARAAGGPLAVMSPDWPSQSPLRARLFALREKSALLNYVILRFLEFDEGLNNEPPLFRAGSAAPAAPAAKDFPIDEELAAVSVAYGSRVTFLFLALFDPSDPSAVSPVEAAFDAWCRGGTRSCVNTRRSHPQFAARHASPYGFPNTGFNVGHMNAEGHAVAGALLAQELERLIEDAVL